MSKINPNSLYFVQSKNGVGYYSFSELIEGVEANDPNPENVGLMAYELAQGGEFTYELFGVEYRITQVLAYAV